MSAFAEFQVRPGDRWDGTAVTVTRDGVDFTSAVVDLTLRRSPDGPTVLTPTYSTVASDGSITVTFYITGEGTRDLEMGRTYHGQLRIHIPSSTPGNEPTFGPYTAFTWTLEGVQDPVVSESAEYEVTLSSGGSVGPPGSDGTDGSGFELGDPIFIHPTSRNMYAFIGGLYYPLTWTLVNGFPALTPSDSSTASPT